MSRNNHVPLVQKQGDVINFSDECIDVARNILDSVNQGEESKNKLQHGDSVMTDFQPKTQDCMGVSASGEPPVILSPSSSLNQPRRNGRLSLGRHKMKKTKSQIELEQGPAKLRKSNSENRRPPAMQDNNVEKGRKLRSRASMGDILKVKDLNATATTVNIGRTQDVAKAKVLENSTTNQLKKAQSTVKSQVHFATSPLTMRRSNSENIRPQAAQDGYKARRRSLRLMGNDEMMGSLNIDSIEVSTERAQGKQETSKLKALGNEAMVSQEIDTSENADKMKTGDLNPEYPEETSLLKDINESRSDGCNKDSGEIIIKRNVSVEVKALKVPMKEMQVNLIPLSLEPLQTNSTEMAKDSLQSNSTEMEKEPLQSNSIHMGKEPLHTNSTEMEKELLHTNSTQIEREPLQSNSFHMAKEPRQTKSTRMEIEPRQTKPNELEIEPQQTNSTDTEIEPQQTNSSEQEIEPEKTNSTELGAVNSCIDTPPPTDVSKYKELNSSIEVLEFKLSQQMVQFYLLGRYYVNLSQLNFNFPKKVTIVVVTNIIRSSFISCLIVADKTGSLQCNLSGQAAKSWSSKLQIGQILLLTKFGLVMEGQGVRLMQVSTKDDVKIIGVAGNMKELNTEAKRVLEKVRMISKVKGVEDISIEPQGGQVDNESINLTENEITMKRREAKEAVLATSTSSEDETSGPPEGSLNFRFNDIGDENDVFLKENDTDNNYSLAEERGNAECSPSQVEHLSEEASSSEDEESNRMTDGDDRESNNSSLNEKMDIRSSKRMTTKDSLPGNKEKKAQTDKGGKAIDRLCDLDRLMKGNGEDITSEGDQCSGDDITSDGDQRSGKDITSEGDQRSKMRIKPESNGESKAVPDPSIESDDSSDETDALPVENDSSSNEEDDLRYLRSKPGQIKLNATSSESESETDTDTCDTDRSTENDDIDVAKSRKKNRNSDKDLENSEEGKTSKVRKSIKGRKSINNLLRFDLSESEDDKLDKKDIDKRKLKLRKKKISRDESKSGTDKDDISEDDEVGNGTEVSLEEIRSCTDKDDLREKQEEDNGTTNTSLNDGSRDSDNDTSDEDSHTDEDSHKKDCSCHSCRNDIKTNKSLGSSKFTRKDNSQVPNPSQIIEPQLDSYFTNVDVSFDELKDLSEDESIPDVDNEAADLIESKPQEEITQAATMTQRKPELKNKPDKISLGELWLGKERDLGNKTKVKEIKADETAGSKQSTSNFPEKAKETEKEEEIADNEEEYGVKETYSDYCPKFLKIGLPHPDTVMQSSSLASVSPPDITRKLNLPQDLIDNGLLSNVQLEAVTYASQIHEVIMLDNTRAGYLIGDGAGVGKGRSIAGIILENWMCGRKKSVWISASQDLMHDAVRDLKDIGAGEIEVASITSFGYHKKINMENGVIYSTFSGLIGKTSTKNRRYDTRLEQLQDWLGSNGQFQGPIIFDECHKAKNLVPPNGGKPTKTGLAVLSLQNNNPKARVVYSSATGASEPKNMAYMVRLGMWGQGINFNNFKEFSNALENRGTGGLEQVALDLKLRGCYIARQLSFKGVDFNIVEVPLTQEFIQVYNQSVEVWRELQTQVYDQCSKYPREGRGDPRKRNFWGFMQKFFKYLAISSKITHVVGLVRTELAEGNCVVIGLQSTGEAAATEFEMDSESTEKYPDQDITTEDSAEESVIENKKISQFSSAASKVLKSVVTSLIPCKHGSCHPAKCDERNEVWSRVMELVPSLPTSSLDQLIEELGGTKKVAELTGRHKRLERGCDGSLAYVKRVAEVSGSKDVNICEKELFMSGKKKIAIISASSSTGISLQADKRVKNQRRRVHITIELPWSADSAIQQFGRTHRSNQSSAPKYVFVISALHGEKRFASIVAKRLENLGALTHGDRRSTRTSDLSSLNFHTVYAKSALKNLVLAITEGEQIPMPKPPSNWKNKAEFYTWLADRLEEAGIYSLTKVLDEEQYPSITKFMNRLLCVKVQDQNVIFTFFTATLDRVIAQAKREGRYDTGIVDVVGQEKAIQVQKWSFKVRHATGTTTTNVTKFLITRGMSFEEATKLFKNLQHPTEGFWISNRKGLKLAVLVIAIPDAGHYRHWKYLIYRPNTGKVFSTMSYEDLKDKYRKASPEVAENSWNKQYNQSMNLCFHAYRSKDHSCKIIRDGGECEEGMRRRNYHVISGSLLSVWPEIEKALGSCLVKSARKIQMVRINNDEERIIGINIPNQVADQLINSLQKIDLTKLNRGLETEAEESLGKSKASGGAPPPVVNSTGKPPGQHGAPLPVMGPSDVRVVGSVSAHPAFHPNQISQHPGQFSHHQNPQFAGQRPPGFAGQTIYSARGGAHPQLVHHASGGPPRMAVQQPPQFGPLPLQFQQQPLLFAQQPQFAAYQAHGGQAPQFAQRPHVGQPHGGAHPQSVHPPRAGAQPQPVRGGAQPQPVRGGAQPQLVHSSGGGVYPQPVHSSRGGSHPQPVQSARGNAHSQLVQYAKRGAHPQLVQSARGGAHPQPVQSARGGAHPQPVQSARGGVHPQSVQSARGGVHPQPVQSARK